MGRKRNSVVRNKGGDNLKNARLTILKLSPDYPTHLLAEGEAGVAQDRVLLVAKCQVSVEQSSKSHSEGATPIIDVPWQ